MSADTKIRRIQAVLMAAALLGACAGPQELPDVPRNPLLHEVAHSDLPAAERTIQTALETTSSGAELLWRSTNGISLEVTPLRTFRITSGHFCRDFRVVLRTASLTRAAARTACRTQEGLWLEVEPQVEPPPQ